MKKLVAIVMIAIVVIILAIIVIQKRSTNGSAAMQYKIMTVAYADISKTVSATGTLKPWSTVDIKSKAGGRINDLRVDVGSKVKKGEVIALIDQSDTLLTVHTAQANIEQAQAKTVQAGYTYTLTKKETITNIANALAALKAAKANKAAMMATMHQAAVQAKAQPDITNASIAEAKASLDQAVQSLAALKVTNQQDLASATASYDQAKANEYNSRVAFERQERLAKLGFVAQQTVDTDRATYEVDKATLQSAKMKRDTIEAAQSASVAEQVAKVNAAREALKSAQASSADIESKNAGYDTAKANYNQAVEQVNEAQATYDQSIAKTLNNDVAKQDIASNRASIESDKATLINAEDTLRQTVVTAPSDGVVIEKDVSKGTIITSAVSSVSTGTTLVTVAEVDRMYVNAAVDETDLAGVRERQNVLCSFDAYPGRTFNGVVTRIDPESTVTNNVTQFDVRVEIDNKSPDFKLLRQGMNSTCTFISDKKSHVLNLPSDAISIDDSGQSYVTVASGGTVAPADPMTKMPVDPNVVVGCKIERRPVRTGLVGDDDTEIVSGLSEGEKVVVSVESAPSEMSGPPDGPPKGSFGGMPKFPKERKR